MLTGRLGATHLFLERGCGTFLILLNGFIPMLKIGLTGGIGSGKTRVADYFQSWGASVVDTDVIAHSLTAPGGRAIEPIRREFGAGMISTDVSLNRVAMR